MGPVGAPVWSSSSGGRAAGITTSPITSGTRITSNALRVPITHSYPMSEAPRALADFGGHKLGKLVVDTRR